MSIGSPQSPLVSSRPPAVPPDPSQRLTVEQYHEMINSGILPEDNSMELLEGRLVRKMPKYPPHRISTKLLHKGLEAHNPARLGCGLPGAYHHRGERAGT